MFDGMVFNNTYRLGRLSDSDPSVYISDLRNITITLTRRNIPNPDKNGAIQRDLDNPDELKVHFNPDEGKKSIFDRENVIVNKEENGERILFINRNDPNLSNSSQRDNYVKQTPAVRRETQEELSTKQSTDDRNLNRELHNKSPNYDKKSRSDYHRRNVSSERRSKSPDRSRRDYSCSPIRNRRNDGRSRRYDISRSPRKYKHSSANSSHRRSRSLLRSTSSRVSRSPSYRKDYHKYERRLRRSRSRESYISSRRRHSRSRSPSRTPIPPPPSRTPIPPPPSRTPIPPPPPGFQPPVDYNFYQGSGYFFPGPMPPRFVPQHFLPPYGGFSRGVLSYPRMPRIRPPHLPVYNRGHSNVPTTSSTVCTTAPEITSTVTSTKTDDNFK